MAYPDEFNIDEPRYYPVILLLDVSGSMYGEPIEALHSAVTEMVNSFVAQRSREKMIKVAIITFGGNGARVHTPYTNAPDLQANGIPHFNADGGTPLGSALVTAKKMIDDKGTTPGKWYQPAIVLVSDGYPTDSWENALQNLIKEGERSSKSIRIGVPIGTGADRAMMDQFTGDPAMIFYAQDVGAIANAFKQVVISVTKSQERAKPIDANPTVKRTVQSTVKRPPRHDDDDE